MMHALASSLSPVAFWVAFSSAKAIVVVALVLVCRSALLPWLSAQARHRLWYAVIVCLIIPFGFKVQDLSSHDLFTFSMTTNEGAEDPRLSVSGRVPRMSNERQEIPDAQSNRGKSSHGGYDQQYLQSMLKPDPVTAGPRAMTFQVWYWLIVIWFSVALALLATTAWNLVAYFRIKALARAVDPSIEKLLTRCKLQLGVRRDIRLLEAPQIHSPAVYGWWSPTLLLPLGFVQHLNKDELRHVFLHELAHVRRHDILINWLGTVAQIVHWFNPFVWYGLHKMRVDMEPACDARVMISMSEAEQRSYGNTLIKLTDFYSERRSQLLGFRQGVGVVDSGFQLKRRIQMIAQFRPSRTMHSAIAALALTAITSVALTQPRSNPDLTRDAATTSDEVDRDKAIDSLSVPTQPILPAVANIASGSTAQGTSGRKIVIAQAAARTAADGQGDRPANTAETKAVSVTQANVTAKADAADNAKPTVKETPAAYGVPIEQLIAHVAEKTRKRFIVDPRVRGHVQLVGQNINQVDYAGLLTILRIHAFAGVEVNGYVNVVPISEARNLAVPKAIDGKEYPDDQWMSITIHPKNACAATFIPLLRPLVPQYAHMAAETSGNSLLIIDTFANIKKIESIVKDLDARSKSDGQWANGQCGEKVVK